MSLACLPHIFSSLRKIHVTMTPSFFVQSYFVQNLFHVSSFSIIADRHATVMRRRHSNFRCRARLSLSPDNPGGAVVARAFEQMLTLRGATMPGQPQCLLFD